MEAPLLECLFNKVEGLMAPTQAFSCEYCEIFKNTYVEEHLLTGASIFFPLSEEISHFTKIVLRLYLWIGYCVMKLRNCAYNIYHKQPHAPHT